MASFLTQFEKAAPKIRELLDLNVIAYWNIENGNTFVLQKQDIIKLATLENPTPYYTPKPNFRIVLNSTDLAMIEDNLDVKTNSLTRFARIEFLLGKRFLAEIECYQLYNEQEVQKLDKDNSFILVNNVGTLNFMDLKKLESKIGYSSVEYDIVVVENGVKLRSKGYHLGYDRRASFKRTSGRTSSSSSYFLETIQYPVLTVVRKITNAIKRKLK